MDELWYVSWNVPIYRRGTLLVRGTAVRDAVVEKLKQKGVEEDEIFTYTAEVWNTVPEDLDKFEDSVD